MFDEPDCFHDDQSEAMNAFLWTVTYLETRDVIHEKRIIDMHILSRRSRHSSQDISQQDMVPNSLPLPHLFRSIVRLISSQLEPGFRK